MNTLYWITRLDDINTALTVLTVISTIICIICTGMYFGFSGQSVCDEARGRKTSVEECKGYVKICTKTLKWSIPLCVFSCLSVIFTPTTKEALLIYGVGGTVDYLKNNPVAKELPNKCILALDKWTDTLIEKSDTVK